MEHDAHNERRKDGETKAGLLGVVAEGSTSQSTKNQVICPVYGSCFE